MLGKEDSVNENHLSPDCAALASAAVPIIIPRKEVNAAMQDEVNTKVVAIMIKGGKSQPRC